MCPGGYGQGAGSVFCHHPLLFHTPLVTLFVAGSEVYHDYYRWPRVDRHVFEDWQRTTDWGKLFQTYASR